MKRVTVTCDGFKDFSPHTLNTLIKIRLINLLNKRIGSVFVPISFFFYFIKGSIGFVTNDVSTE
jgi:hypothetical protein